MQLFIIVKGIFRGSVDFLWIRHYQIAAERAGVPYVKAHGLRHSFASLACHLGLREETAMRIGGWADYHTMKKIYTHVDPEDIVEDSARMLAFYAPEASEESQAEP